MKPKRAKTRTLSFVLAVVLAVVAVRAGPGDAIQAFVNGVYVGFTDDV